jgi:hypothetical protein
MHRIIHSSEQMPRGTEVQQPGQATPKLCWPNGVKSLPPVDIGGFASPGCEVLTECSKPPLLESHASTYPALGWTSAICSKKSSPWDWVSTNIAHFPSSRNMLREATNCMHEVEKPYTRLPIDPVCYTSTDSISQSASAPHYFSCFSIKQTNKNLRCGCANQHDIQLSHPSGSATGHTLGTMVELLLPFTSVGCMMRWQACAPGHTQAYSQH